MGANNFVYLVTRDHYQGDLGDLMLGRIEGRTSHDVITIIGIYITL